MNNIKLMVFISKHKNKILNIAIIILALIITQGIYMKQARIIESLKKEKDTEIKKSQLLGNISKFEKNINAYMNLLNQKQASSVINNINNLAKEAGVKIVSIKPREQMDYPIYIKYSFDLVISAKDYHRIGRFISKIESSPDVYIVDSFNLKPLSESESERAKFSGRITAELKLSTIFFKG